MVFVFSFVGSVFHSSYYIIIYMIIINFLIEACFVGYIGAMLIFLGPYYI